MSFYLGYLGLRGSPGVKKKDLGYLGYVILPRLPRFGGYGSPGDIKIIADTSVINRGKLVKKPGYLSFFTNPVETEVLLYRTEGIQGRI